MDETQRRAIAERLAGRGPNRASNDRYIHDALRCMVDAGACRIGMRNDQPLASGFSACELAKPLARMIDHTALKPDTTEEDIRRLCLDAQQYCFASVCINPSYVPLAAETLKSGPVAVCSVVGFPLGGNRSDTKASEAAAAVRDGASEVDMVLNVGKLKSGRFDYVESDIRAVVAAARETPRTVVKVILECVLLSDEEKVIACVLAQNAGADFVKTSTGFSRGGATAADVALMRRVVGDKMGVKASGGVRTQEDAVSMVAHGATRIGASASVAIVNA